MIKIKNNLFIAIIALLIYPLYLLLAMSLKIGDFLLLSILNVFELISVLSLCIVSIVIGIIDIKKKKNRIVIITGFIVVLLCFILHAYLLIYFFSIKNHIIG